jgi:hypothetical protein
MASTYFTENDYFSGALHRLDDLTHLRTNGKSVIFSLYCAGVAIECMLRAYITKYTREFDSKHNLLKLYEKSLLASYLDEEEKQELAVAIKIAHRIWTNELRYTSDKRMKRLIAHEFVRNGHKGTLRFKDINKYVEKYYADIFVATELILKTGQLKWI